MAFVSGQVWFSRTGTGSAPLRCLQAPQPLVCNAAHEDGAESAKLSRADFVRLVGTFTAGVAVSGIQGHSFRAARAVETNAVAVPDMPSKSLEVEQFEEGTGAQVVAPGSLVSCQYVIRRRNGYFVDQNDGADGADFLFRVGANQAVQGLELALMGRKRGARVRFVLPPELGYVQGVKEKGAPGPIPKRWDHRQNLWKHHLEPLVFEVRVTRVS
ncbi:Peptidyl-prolyl cis-trans isomerase FKBP16-1, chloroplastic [Porphyridium purpureum]|uniref:peptidylprolyl isomerase n=1 Tax=Porphyridium purpureum TaxID=35688 RepID=A0A5J4YTN6_PORPP|nr:Peptidyl-prolyl cis-trans isomerase FKBP16-1, chloroplastic [Porphyridium purpureum]|eukprot:POR4064..scf227_4